MTEHNLRALCIQKSKESERKEKSKGCSTRSKDGQGSSAHSSQYDKNQTLATRPEGARGRAGSSTVCRRPSGFQEGRSNITPSSQDSRGHTPPSSTGRTSNEQAATKYVAAAAKRAQGEARYVANKINRRLRPSAWQK